MKNNIIFSFLIISFSNFSILGMENNAPTCHNDLQLDKKAQDLTTHAAVQNRILSNQLIMMKIDESTQRDQKDANDINELLKKIETSDKKQKKEIKIRLSSLNVRKKEIKNDLLSLNARIEKNKILLEVFADEQKLLTRKYNDMIIQTIPKELRDRANIKEQAQSIEETERKSHALKLYPGLETLFAMGATFHCDDSCDNPEETVDIIETNNNN